MAGRKKGRFRIGTSNIVLPGPKYTFPEAYQDKSRLTYYASLLNSVEINSTFYKLPMAKTFEKWATEVPEDFQFTVKISKAITHAKGLLYPPEAIEAFMLAANHLNEKKGCLLIQFPASITVHFADKTEEILEQIKQFNTDEHKWRIAIELRHHSWYKASTYELLHRYNTSLVIHDKPLSKTPEMEPAENFVYLRFHGPGGDYRGGYHEEHLEAKAMDIKEWLKEGKDVYAYFNNTVGDAFDDARTLERLVNE